MMPIKVSESGRIWLLGANGSHYRELSIEDASQYLESTQTQILRDAERTEFEAEKAFRKRRRELATQEKDIEARNEQLQCKTRELEQRVQNVVERAEKIRSSEMEFDERQERLEKAILERQGLERGRLRAERAELERLKTEQNEALDILKLEKEALDRDRIQHAETERQTQAENKRRCLILDAEASDLQRREENLRQQQEELEKATLEFELLKLTESDEARKTNAEILERDRIVQEAEAWEREDLRVAEAKRAEEEALQKLQAAWDLELKKFQARADGLEEAEAKVAADTKRLAVVEQATDDTKVSLTKVTEEFETFRKDSRNKISSLIAEHEVRYAAVQVELKSALEVAWQKTEQLQCLREQMVEEDLKILRERSHSADLGSLHEKFFDSPATHVDTSRKEASGGVKERKEGESSNAKAVTAPEHSGEAGTLEKVVDRIQGASPEAASPTISQSLNEYVFIDSRKNWPGLNHALTRNTDNEDYLHDSDSDIPV